MRRTPLPAPLDSSPAVPAALPLVLTFRASSGVAFALEVRAAAKWEDVLIEPPAAEVADVRAITLETMDGAPSELPGWLAIFDAPPPAWGSTAQRLWPASPHYRARGVSEAEFRAAGVAAQRHAGSRGEVADPIALCWRDAGLDGPPPSGAARERWLQVRFGTAERFASLLLLGRIAERDPETASALRFLDEAAVPEGGAWADLAIDRRVLLEQATPWRYFDRTFTPAMAALGAWRRRYEAAYARHYAGARESAGRARQVSARVLARAETADRLASILGHEGRALGPLVRRMMASLSALPDAPVAGMPTTGGVLLGAEHPSARGLDALSEEVGRALESRLAAIASGLARVALDREGDALSRVLAAVQASDVSDLDRVLDDRLAAHLARLLRGAEACDPLADVAARFPEVRADDLDAAAEAFRDALATAVLVAPDGVARLAR